MKTVRMIGLSAVVVGVMFSGSSAGAAPRVTLKCGQTVTTSVKLGNDLLNCPADGIVVGASNITIDLNGHRITGPPNFDPKVCSCGVNDASGFDHVTLRSGRIEGFRNGASFTDAEAVTVRGLETTGQLTNPNTFQGGNGIFLQRAPGSRVGGSTFTAAFRGIEVADSSNVLIESIHIAEIEHAGVDLFGVTDSTVRHANIDHTGGGDFSIEVLNSSRILAVHNLIRHFGYNGISVVGEKYPKAAGEALGNRIESNTLDEGVVSEATGVFLGEIDGGTVRETTVARNTVRGATGDGIFAGYANSSDGLGNPPFEEVVGKGPSESLIEANLVSGSSPDGIHLNAPGNVVTGNRANRNTEWGIYAIEGTTDGGGNTAHHNGQPEQCRGVVCNGVTAASPLQRTARPGFHRFRGVGRDSSL